MALTEPAAAQRQRGVCCELEMPLGERAAGATADLLRAVADPTRLSMLACLYRALEPVCICDFTAAYGLSQPTISHHMGKLRGAGLVTARKEGVWVYYRLAEPVPPAIEALLKAALMA